MAFVYQNNKVPDNVATGDFTITVPTYACGNTVQPIVLDDSTAMLPGRYVVIKATSITGYVGANVTPPAGLSVSGVSREFVNFSGTTYDCIVVTLV